MLSGLPPLTLALLLAAGIALDLLLGEARRRHPLVGFGRLAQWLERRVNLGGWRIARGAACWALAVLPLTAAAAWLCAFGRVVGLALHALLLYLCLGLRSLRDHTLPIHASLTEGDLARARWLTSRIVSRDTTQAGETDLARAGAESLLENGNDAVFGTLFWYIALAALRDTDWQRNTRERLARDGARLRGLLAAHGIRASGAPLFHWWAEGRPEDFHEHVARHAIWVRLFGQVARGIRLGLPARERDWDRIERALQEWTKR